MGHSFVVATSHRPPRKELEKVSDILKMSAEELSRAEVMQQLKGKRITQRQGT